MMKKSVAQREKADIIKSRLSLEKEKLEAEREIEREKIQTAENALREEYDLKKEKLRHIETERKRKFILTIGAVAILIIIGAILIVQK